jgi:hypothetical protein
VIAYQATQWHDLFVAIAGVGATLAGLTFVAVSLNAEAILIFGLAPGRTSGCWARR